MDLLESVREEPRAGGNPAGEAVMIWIPGQPVSKLRGIPKIGYQKRKGDGKLVPFAYIATPAKLQDYEAFAGFRATEAMAGRSPLRDGVVGQARITFRIPPSWPKWRQHAARAGTLPHTGKPDVTNVLKAIEDGFNGIVYLDDSQLIKWTYEKRYGVRPGVQVWIAPFQLPTAV